VDMRFDGFAELDGQLARVNQLSDDQLDRVNRAGALVLKKRLAAAAKQFAKYITISKKTEDGENCMLVFFGGKTSSGARAQTAGAVYEFGRRYRSGRMAVYKANGRKAKSGVKHGASMQPARPFFAKVCEESRDAMLSAMAEQMDKELSGGDV
jgi:hypothetical protein